MKHEKLVVKISYPIFVHCMGIGVMKLTMKISYLASVQAWTIQRHEQCWAQDTEQIQRTKKTSTGKKNTESRYTELTKNQM
jgi:hypothetical protein